MGILIQIIFFAASSSLLIFSKGYLWVIVAMLCAYAVSTDAGGWIFMCEYCEKNSETAFLILPSGWKSGFGLFEKIMFFISSVLFSFCGSRLIAHYLGTVAGVIGFVVMWLLIHNISCRIGFKKGKSLLQEHQLHVERIPSEKN